ncbi:hypothetical protein [Nocardia sp. CA-119907]|uniref:hypothetical protein n=1 Tax=Nocardia sp. CA-119907 TaxID=3239973 RepID=UPI003D981164
MRILESSRVGGRFFLEEDVADLDQKALAEGAPAGQAGGLSVGDAYDNALAESIIGLFTQQPSRRPALV